MKKIFHIALACCLTLLSGVFLVACGGSKEYKLHLKNETELVEMILKENKKEIFPDLESNYKVKKDSNIRVEIRAKDFGVDMKNVKVTLNGIDKKLIENPNYSGIPSQGKDGLNYGYFLIPKINKNYDISLSGGEVLKSKFTFEISEEDINNPDIEEKLKNTSVQLKKELDSTLTEEDVVEGENFISLYDVLKSDKKTFERTFNSKNGVDDTFRTFNLKFGGINPYNFQNGFPFKIRNNANMQEKEILNMDLGINSNYYTVDMGDIGNDYDYSIIVDFSKVALTKFSLSRPMKNGTYDIDFDLSEIDINQESIIEFKPLINDGKIDYSGIEVWANELKLEKQTIEGEEQKNKFVLPKGKTPKSTGGFEIYSIEVKGIKYNVPTYKVRMNANESNLGYKYFINPQLSKDGASDGSPSGLGDNGEYISFEGDKNIISWKYKLNESAQKYETVFDLYDYDVRLNPTTENDGVLFNIKETLLEAVEGNDFEKNLGNGIVFKAKLNRKTNAYDDFKLEFECKSDLANKGEIYFFFDNFILKERKINVGYSFSQNDNRIKNIAYAISATENEDITDWKYLNNGETQEVSFTGKKVVIFKIVSTSTFLGEHEFKIEDSLVSSSSLDSVTEYKNGTYYTYLKYLISDVQFEETKDFKLIKV